MPSGFTGDQLATLTKSLVHATEPGMAAILAVLTLAGALHRRGVLDAAAMTAIAATLHASIRASEATHGPTPWTVETRRLLETWSDEK